MTNERKLTGLRENNRSLAVEKDLFQTAFENGLHPTLLFGENNSLLAMNRPARDMFLKAGTPSIDFHKVPPGDFLDPWIIEALPVFLKTGSTTAVEQRSWPGPGGMCHYRVRFNRVVSPEGVFQGTLVSFEDISASRTAQLSLSWELLVNQTLAELSHTLMTETSLESVAFMFIDRAKVLTQSPAGFSMFIDQVSGSFLVIEPPEKPGRGQGIPAVREYRGEAGWVVRERRMVVMNEASPEPLENPLFSFWRIPIQRCLSVPVLEGPTLLGQITLANSLRDYTRRDFEVVERLATLFGLAIRRYRIEENFKGALEKATNLENIINASPNIAIRRKLEEGWPVEYVSSNLLIWGYSPTEFLAPGFRFFQIIHPEDQSKLRLVHRQFLKEGLEQMNFEYRIRAKNGKYLWLDDRSLAVHDVDGKPVTLQSVLMDVTDQKLRDQQILHSQKLESIGVFAGGLAHDFNNILTAIYGFSEMTRDLVEDPLARENLEEVLVAARRGRDLIENLLVFSRQTKGDRQTLDLVGIVRETLKLVRAIVPEKINVVEELPETPVLVFSDPSDIRQVVMNLCLNAGQALRGKGDLLEVRVGRVKLDKERSFGGNTLPPGEYAYLRVRDNGEGMSARVLDRLFQPFFTTRAIGEGSGMGLAVVHGIIGKYEGAIEVSTELGSGTSFDIFLPLWMGDK